VGWDHGWAVLFYGVDEVGDYFLVAQGCDCHGVFYSAGIGDGFELRGFEPFDGPVDDVTVGEDDASLFAVDFDFVRVAGLYDGGGFEDALGAVFVFDEGVAHVLDFYVVRDGGGLGEDGFGGSHHPDNQVNCVCGLLDEWSAAIELPSASPCGAVVVVLASVLFQEGVCDVDFSEPSGSDGLVCGLVVGCGSLLECAGELYAGGFAGSGHFVDFFECYVERFFAEDVFFEVRGVNGGFGVQAAGGGDYDGVEVDFLCEGVEAVGKVFDAVPVGELLCSCECSGDDGYK